MERHLPKETLRGLELTGSDNHNVNPCFFPIEKGTKPYTIESQAQQVFDVSGAGDTVISLLGLGLSAGATFKESAVLANTAAGIVVSKVGTATASIEELKRALTKH